MYDWKDVHRERHCHPKYLLKKYGFKLCGAYWIMEGSVMFDDMQAQSKMYYMTALEKCAEYGEKFLTYNR